MTCIARASLVALDSAISAARLVGVLAQRKRDHGLAKISRTDNGPEFFGEAFKQWSTDNGVVLQHSSLANRITMP